MPSLSATCGSQRLRVGCLHVNRILPGPGDEAVVFLDVAWTSLTMARHYNDCVFAPSHSEFRDAGLDVEVVARAKFVSSGPNDAPLHLWLGGFVCFAARRADFQLMPVKRILEIGTPVRVVPVRCGGYDCLTRAGSITRLRSLAALVVDLEARNDEIQRAN